MKLHTTYFGSVNWYRQLITADEPVVIDDEERYVKQTSRNRCEIATANGKQVLTVPVTVQGVQKVREVLVSEHGNWRHHHWEALKSAYGMSPFFDYYQDDIYPFFDEQAFHDNHWEHLYDYNMAIIEKIKELLGVANVPITPLSLHITSPIPPIKYYQTFQKKNGFIAGLSILDLLFNEGPESILYLTSSH